MVLLLHTILMYFPRRPTDQLPLVVPKTRLKLRGEEAFSIVVPKLWNALPVNNRQFLSLFWTHFFFGPV